MAAPVSIRAAARVTFPVALACATPHAVYLGLSHTLSHTLSLTLSLTLALTLALALTTSLALALTTSLVFYFSLSLAIPSPLSLAVPRPIDFLGGYTPQTVVPQALPATTVTRGARRAASHARCTTRCRPVRCGRVTAARAGGGGRLHLDLLEDRGDPLRWRLHSRHWLALLVAAIGCSCGCSEPPSALAVLPRALLFLLRPSLPASRLAPRLCSRPGTALAPLPGPRLVVPPARAWRGLSGPLQRALAGGLSARAACCP
eukprot:scaffold181179_cov33-Tisochrysis_lutea.AAC.6